MIRFTAADLAGHGLAARRNLWPNTFALLTEYQMSWIKITERVQSSVPAFLYDLLHGGKATIGGRELRIESLVLPVVSREADYLLWSFQEPVRVQTPGPDGKLSSIKQYRDRIELSVFPWAFVVVYFDGN